MYNGKKVLIVDDSGVERKILNDIVSKLGFSVIEASNGDEGIAMATEHVPDLILMDVVMPGINGFQTTKQIMLNDSLKNIPVIMCTTKNQDSDKMWGVKQGAKAYVVKPVVESVLVDEIKKVMG